MTIRTKLHLHPKLEVAVQLYRVPVQIIPRPGILDPQGAAVAGALRTLGFDTIADIRVGRFITVDVNAASPAAATAAVRSMCEKLLANPVIEDFVLEEPTLQQGGQS
jgi:phosphoribosylformylglycinamidine synthase PurS subunit